MANFMLHPGCFCLPSSTSHSSCYQPSSNGSSFLCIRNRIDRYTRNGVTGKSPSSTLLIQAVISQGEESTQKGWLFKVETAAVVALTVLQMTVSGTLGVAEAVLYSPDTKVPRSAEVALRRAIPAVNSTTKKIQESLEDIFYLLRIPQRKPFGTMEADVKKAMKLATEEKGSIIATVPDNNKDKAVQLYESLTTGKGGLPAMLDAIADKDPDKISLRLVSSLETVAQLELLQAPGLPYLVPNDYQRYPRLTGRATVEFTVRRGDGSTFTVAAGGGPKDVGKIEVAKLALGYFRKLALLSILTDGHMNHVYSWLFVVCICGA
ncbi:hypothetical protein L7F22_006767 [Adiantum nelumboides]|nr:hypothetical protein [Adiantum nelumboides]